MNIAKIHVWKVPVLLYGTQDEMIPYKIVKKFSEENNCRLNFVENGQHWLHTDAIYVDDDIDSAFVKVENLRKTIENKNFVYENNNIYVTMTFGIIERDSGKVDDVLLKSADKLLYRGKINGKNVVVKA